MILILLPAADYDPTESSVPWQAMRDAGIEVRFATPQGLPAHADPRLVDIGFGLLSSMLITGTADLDSYAKMIESEPFKKPLAYADVDPSQFEGMLIPGGHAKGLRTLLESKQTQQLALQFFQVQQPVTTG